MAHRNSDWQSHPITFKDPPTINETDYPSLQDAARSKHRGKRYRQLPMRTVHNPQPSTNVWSIPPESPSATNGATMTHEWSYEEVAEGNKEAMFPEPEVVVEKELIMLARTYTDKLTEKSRFQCEGYSQLIGRLQQNAAPIPNSDAAKFRSLVLSAAVGKNGGIHLNAPQPNLMPDWKSKLPDPTLNQEFMILSRIRGLGIGLGPRKIAMLRNESEYRSLKMRREPNYKRSFTIGRESIEENENMERKTEEENSYWKEDSDNRSSDSYSSSSNSRYGSRPLYDNPTCSKYSNEIRNSRYNTRNFERESREEYDRRNNYGYGYGRDDYSHRDYCNYKDDSEWEENGNGDWREKSRYEDDYYGRHDNRYDDRDYRKEDYPYHGDYGRNENNSRDSSYMNRLEEDRYKNDYDYDDKSRYASDYDGRKRKEPGATPIAEEREYRASTKTEFVATRFSKKIPVWRETDVMSEKSIERRPLLWKARLSKERPVVKERKRIPENELRVLIKDDSLPWNIRKAFRCLHGIQCNSSVALADEMGRIELSIWDHEIDGDIVKERVIEKYGLDKIEKEINEETILLALPKTPITLSFSAGAIAEIIFERECNDVLVKKTELDELRKRRLEGVVKTCELTNYVVSELHFGREAPLVRRNDSILTFDSPRNAIDAIDELQQWHYVAERIPRTLVTGYWDGSYAKRECILELDWERKAIHGFLVYLPNLDTDESQVDRVMRYAAEHFTHVGWKMHPPNKMYVPLPWSPYSAEDDRLFLMQILIENGVSVGGIEIMRVSERKHQTIQTEQKRRDCTRAINRRLLKIAIDQRVWAGFHPSDELEWDMMLKQGRFSWTISFPSDQSMYKEMRNSATVKFDSFEQGEAIAREMQRQSPCRSGDNGFILNIEDRKGVFSRAKLRVHYDVPTTVRALTINRLNEMDIQWRKGSHFTHAEMATESEVFNQWACLISDENANTPPGYCRLIVEGFPSGIVDDCCAELMRVFKGDIMKCEGEEEWLLTGIGRNVADEFAQKALKKLNVLVDFNVLGKEIRLFGEREKTELVERKLKEIAIIRLNLTIRTQLTVGLPVYLNRTCEAIQACGGINMMQKVIGDCTLKLSPDDIDKCTLDFEGTVAAFDRFKTFLGDLDDLLRESGKSEYEKKRKTDPSLKDPSLSPLTSPLLCPICYCRPSSDFYRLEACGHVYCIQCLYHQLSSELSSRSFPLVCRHEKCDHPIVISDILHLLIGDSDSFRLEHLDEIKLRPLITAAVGHALQTKRDRLVPCRTADCAGIFARSMDSNIVRCKTCTKTTCAGCGFEPHRGYSCEEYLNIRDNADASLALYVKETKRNVRKCPNGSCSAVIEKSVGCNHMECLLCRTHFCWLCGHSSSSQGDIYQHMNEKHGGNGLHMDDGEMFMLQFDD